MTTLVNLRDSSHSILDGRHNDIQLISSDGNRSSSNCALLSINTGCGTIWKEAFDKEVNVVTVELDGDCLLMVLDFVHHGIVPLEIGTDKMEAFEMFGIRLPEKKFEKGPMPTEILERDSLEAEDLSDLEDMTENPFPSDCEDLEKVERFSDEEEAGFDAIVVKGEAEDWDDEDMSRKEEYNLSGEEEEDCKPIKKKRKNAKKTVKTDKVYNNKMAELWNMVPKDKSKLEPGICVICNISHRHLPAHMEYNHSLKNTTCEKCGRVYKSKMLRDKHVQVAHQDICCEQCGKVLSNEANLKLHMISIHSKGSDRPFPCDLCPKAYVIRAKLVEHQARQHSEARCHICEICGNDFKTAQQLTAHRKKVHNISIRQAPLVATKSTSDFMMMEDGSIMPRKFSTPKEIRPRKTKYDKKPKVEGEEKKKRKPSKSTYVKKEGPRKERTRKENMNLEELKIRQLDKLKLQCMVCDRIFEDTREGKNPNIHGVILRAKAHVLSLHASEEEKPFPCTLCSKRFVRKEVLEYHMNIHENKRAYTCSFCGTGFNHAGNRNAHERSVHLGIKKKKGAQMAKSRRSTGCKRAEMETPEERKARWMAAISKEQSMELNSGSQIEQGSAHVIQDIKEDPQMQEQIQAHQVEPHFLL